MTAILILAANGTQTQNPLGSLVLFLPLIALFYFLMIRPQKARQRAQQDLMKAVGVGDEIETIGGIYGTVVRGDDDNLWVEIAPGTTVKIARGAVRRKIYAEEDEPTENQN